MKRAKPISRGSKLPQSILEYAASTADPFACSACIPDGSRNTGCFSVKQDAAITTGAAGTSNLFAWAPLVNDTSFTDSGSAAVTPTVAGNWVKAVANPTFFALYAKYRPVSAGLKVTYVGNTQTDSGVIIIGQVSGGVSLSTFNGASLATATSVFQTYETYPLRNGGKVVWRSESEMDTATWINMNATPDAASTALVLPYLVVIVYGAQSSQATLHVEAVTNYEGQFASQTFMPGGLDDNSPKPAASGWYATAKNIISDVAQIAPVVGAMGSGYLSGGFSGALMSLSNGLMAPGRLSGAGLPRLPSSKQRLRLEL